MKSEVRKPTLLLVGFGDLGAVLLEYLVRLPELKTIVVASRNSHSGELRCNLARLGAIAQGFQTTIEFRSMDLNNLEQTSEIIRETDPDVILTAATMLTWWLPDRLPEAESRKLKEAGFGMWIPIHLNLTKKLMEAVKVTRYSGHILTAPFPDVSNVVLGRLGLEPTCGIGNVDEVVPKIRLLVGEKLGVRPLEVSVKLVAHHSIQQFVLNRRSLSQRENREHPPFFLEVLVNGEERLDRDTCADILFSAFPITSGPASHFLTAGCSASLVRALLEESQTDIHAPGPQGLPGGYPVLASNSGVKLNLGSSISMDEAVSLNEKSHRFDGIRRIEEDGSIVFLEKPVSILKSTIGYDCPVLLPREIEDRAQELIERFRVYAAGFGLEF